MNMLYSLVDKGEGLSTVTASKELISTFSEDCGTHEHLEGVVFVGGGRGGTRVAAWRI